MKKTTYYVTIKKGIATVSAKGYDSKSTMNEKYVFEYMKETSEIARKENIEINWIIK